MTQAGCGQLHILIVIDYKQNALFVILMYISLSLINRAQNILIQQHTLHIIKKYRMNF